MDERTKFLNSVYKPLCDRAKEYCKALKAEGIESTFAFYNGHFIKDGESWVEEFFPIPVVSAAGLCDIELEIEGVSVTAKLGRDQALALNYDTLDGKDLEIYGVENYLNDIFNAQIPKKEIKANILNSGERELFFTFKLGNNLSAEELLRIVGYLKDNEFYY